MPSPSNCIRDTSLKKVMLTVFVMETTDPIKSHECLWNEFKQTIAEMKVRNTKCLMYFLLQNLNQRKRHVR